jgi:hypothetical protein
MVKVDKRPLRLIELFYNSHRQRFYISPMAFETKVNVTEKSVRFYSATTAAAGVSVMSSSCAYTDFKGRNRRPLLR